MGRDERRREPRGRERRVDASARDGPEEVASEGRFDIQHVAAQRAARQGLLANASKLASLADAHHHRHDLDGVPILQP